MSLAAIVPGARGSLRVWCTSRTSSVDLRDGRSVPGIGDSGVGRVQNLRLGECGWSEVRNNRGRVRVFVALHWIVVVEEILKPVRNENKRELRWTYCAATSSASQNKVVRRETVTSCHCLETESKVKTASHSFAAPRFWCDGLRARVGRPVVKVA
jgi:hypothetical protein